jgi:FdhD protein
VKTARKQVLRWDEKSARRSLDNLAVEEPLEIRIDSRPLVVTMRTPGHDDELSAGFLASEGLIRSRDDVQAIRANKRNRAGNSIDVFLSPDVAINFQQIARRGYMSSSCGLCGRESIETVQRKFRPIRARMAVSAALVLELPGRLRAAQPTFEQTGGLHAAGIFARDGELIVAREDIGRHNAVDKVIGHGLINSLLPFDEHILVVSGRASFEILQKALSARIPIICAVSAPSSLAVDFAKKSGQTLIGFLRDQRMNVYAGRQRLQFNSN